MERYRDAPSLAADKTLHWTPSTRDSLDTNALRPVARPFRADGGLRLLTGNLGRAVIKVSSVPDDRHTVEAPARVFDDQDAVQKAFDRGEFTQDVVVVVRNQGPRANGMPELHQLTPTLTSLQSKGHRVALVTDGRMSGASGAVPAAIHVTPECLSGGPLGKVQNGDIIRLDSHEGVLEAKVPDATLHARTVSTPDLTHNGYGVGRELFGTFRAVAGDAEAGAASLWNAT